ncbi:MAG: SH3 domain-containing protein, partial [Leptospiraceae bacterium]|nr:SH3 domain-containing protein [Leptospiraceae bacterium]
MGSRLALACAAACLLLAACRKGTEVVTDDTAQLPATTIVTTPDLRVRIAPNTTAVEIGRLTRGEEVRVVQRSAEKVPIGKHNTYWYKVTASNGLTGWVYGAHLALEADGKELQA